jgi:hypothetical protein
MQEKMFHEHTPSEQWFPSYGLLKIKENAQSVRLARRGSADWDLLTVRA